MHAGPSKALLILRAAARSLAANDVFRMAGATAFFTTFALPPMLIIVVRVFGLFLDRRTVGEALLRPLEGPFGEVGTAPILQAIRSFRALPGNALTAAALFLFLLFVATTLFKVVRGALNQLWNIRPAGGSGFRTALRSRSVSVAVILAGGALFLSVQLADAGQQLLQRYLDPQVARFLDRILNTGLVTLISSAWFFLLFQALPDGRPDRRISIAGALFTGGLFTAGKAVLGLLLRPVPVTNFYGVSGAFALVLLFLFYSALFLYVGAALIEAWGTAVGRPVVPKAGAERYRLVRERRTAA